jgi:hypothetical protein
VVGNFLFISSGVDLIWPGGTQINAYRLNCTSSGMDATGPTTANITIVGVGAAYYPPNTCEGIVSSYDQTRLFIGADQSNNLMWQLTADPSTIAVPPSPLAGFGFTQLAPTPTQPFVRQGTPPAYAFDTVSMMTIQEETQLNQNPPIFPPNRVWPGLAGTSYRVFTDLITNFDGNVNAAPGEGLGCSVGGAAAGAAVLIAGIMLTSGLASILLKKRPW